MDGSTSRKRGLAVIHLPASDRCRFWSWAVGQGPRYVVACDAAGALDAADCGQMIRRRRRGRRSKPLVKWWWVVGGSLISSGVAVDGMWLGAARLTYGLQARCVVPGDMMIDWVAPRRRGVRPLSLIGPSAAPVDRR